MKTVLIILIVIAGIIIAGAGAIYFSYFSTGPLATLVIDSGTAQVKTADLWKDASSGMALKQDYSVKTLENSEAKIIFSDSVMRMDQNTEINLDTVTSDKISISQIIGKTWTKLLKISGISSYEISTPDAIATVRGTAFAVEIENGTKILVANGTVAAKIKDKAVEKLIEANKEAKISKDDSDIEDFDIVDDDWIIKNKDLDEQHLKELRQKFIKKYGYLTNYAKKQQNLSDEQINKFVDDWLEGKYSIKKAIENGDIPPAAAKMMPPELKRY